MTKLLNVLLWVLGLLFIILGLRWLIDPQAAAATLGMALSDGVGRSSQIGDFGAFFFTGGLWVLFGVWHKAPIFLYVSATTLGVAALFRLIAWAVQGAALTVDMIAVEVVIAVILLVAAKQFERSAE
ncbi:hypothetical protein [Zhongshania aliphaticivorans]|uniref:hypothetical protein n=1 Tax=Zhongshania aliphaticivorans TaxID=1470434 RepID=UPI00132F98DF|nr:hypothetical protein [Zhongshania aliphaticivorans]